MSVAARVSQEMGVKLGHEVLLTFLFSYEVLLLLAHFFLSKREGFNPVNKAKFELLQQEDENKSIELRRSFFPPIQW